MTADEPSKTMNSNDDDDGTIQQSTYSSSSSSLSSKAIFVLICACNMIQNAIVGGSNNAIMTTLESGFYMTSTETGLFQSVYELVAIFSYPLVGYFGDRSGRKVRWIAVSMSILAGGFLVMSFPHLLESKRGKPPLDPRVVDHLTLCNPNRTISVCSFSSNLRFLSHLKYVFYLSNIINACGSAALPTLAVTLIEDLFPPEKAPIAQGIYYALGGIGIGLGFLATSQFLKVYTYIKKPVWLTPIYAEWVGAWWLVYALGTCISLILCLLLCLFDIGRRRQYLSPSQIPSPSIPTYQLLASSQMNNNNNKNKIVQQNINTETRLVSSSSRTSSFTTDRSSSIILVPHESPLIKNAEQQQQQQQQQQTLSATPTTEDDLMTPTVFKPNDCCSDILTLTKHLLVNLRYMGVTGCAIVEALLVKGYLAFLSKHIEYQFRTTSSHSSVYMGVISLFSVIFGTPLGAYCVKRFDMNGRQCAKFCCIILALSSVIFLGLILHCREPTIGTTHSMPYISTAFADDLIDENVIHSDRIESPCRKECKCDMNIYQPVCDQIHQDTYQNPCLLGCRKILKGEYADCLCLPRNGTVKAGKYSTSKKS